MYTHLLLYIDVLTSISNHSPYFSGPLEWMEPIISIPAVSLSATAAVPAPPFSLSGVSGPSSASSTASIGSGSECGSRIINAVNKLATAIILKMDAAASAYSSYTGDGTGTNGGTILLKEVLWCVCNLLGGTSCACGHVNNILRMWNIPLRHV